jgi:hypothetical protein
VANAPRGWPGPAPIPWPRRSRGASLMRVEPGFVLYDLVLLRLRALVACAHGDELAYREFVDRYRAMATSLGFERHVAMAEAMNICSGQLVI